MAARKQTKASTPSLFGLCACLVCWSVVSLYDKICVACTLYIRKAVETLVRASLWSKSRMWLASTLYHIYPRKSTTIHEGNRCLTALHRLRGQVITWSSESEKQVIAHGIQMKTSFPGCIGYIDGTLFPLACKPRVCGEDYYSYKRGVWP